MTSVKKTTIFIIFIVLLVFLWASKVNAQEITTTASYYGPGFHGRLTANGERFNQYANTAAHKTLPFGTRLKVTNLSNGLHTIVRISDRGPYVKGRDIDLSKGAAQKIGMSGVARVRLQILTKDQ